MLLFSLANSSLFSSSPWMNKSSFICAIFFRSQIPFLSLSVLTN